MLLTVRLIPRRKSNSLIFSKEKPHRVTGSILNNQLERKFIGGAYDMRNLMNKMRDGMNQVKQDVDAAETAPAECAE